MKTTMDWIKAFGGLCILALFVFIILFIWTEDFFYLKLIGTDIAIVLLIALIDISSED